MARLNSEPRASRGVDNPCAKERPSPRAVRGRSRASTGMLQCPKSHRVKRFCLLGVAVVLLAPGVLWSKHGPNSERLAASGPATQVTLFGVDGIELVGPGCSVLLAAGRVTRGSLGEGGLYSSRTGWIAHDAELLTSPASRPWRFQTLSLEGSIPGRYRWRGFAESTEAALEADLKGRGWLDLTGPQPLVLGG